MGRINNRQTAFRLRRREQGSVLLISLMLLVAIAIFGLSTLKGTATNEMIAGNMHQRSIGFQASESAIKLLWTDKKLLENTPDEPHHDPQKEEILLNSKYDQAKIDLKVKTTVQYCGENPIPFGTSLSSDQSTAKLAAQVFDVHGIAEIDSSRVKTNHLARGYLIRPESGRSGNCV